MKQKEKEEAKKSFHFSILRRKIQITNPPTSHLNSNFILTIYLQFLETKSIKKKKKNLTITVLSSRFSIFIKTQIAITGQL